MTDPNTTDQNITAAGLPYLEGSGHELQDAGPIRLQLLAEADDWMSALRTRERKAPLLPSDSPPPIIAEAEAGLQALRHQTSAAWWLARRDLTPEQLIREMLPQRPG